MRAHLRVTNFNEDLAISAYLLAATSAVEMETKRLLVPRSVVLRLTELPTVQDPVELPGGQISSVTSVIADAVTITGCVALGDSPAILVPATDWPVVVGDGYPVVITYVAGYTPPPPDLLHAVKLLATDMFERRANSEDGPQNRVMVSAEYLMARHRIASAA
jgi:uncharacterized phiE125 gp8 family phage protein